jgi:protocatechuate 3,4-dioxygenase beta subunit
MKLAALAVVLALAQAQVPAPPPGTAPAPTALLAGRVIDAATGQPVAGAVVTLIARPGRGTPPLTRLAEGVKGQVAAEPVRVLVNADGRFTFTVVWPGLYDIAADKRGYVGGALGKFRHDGEGAPLEVTGSAPRFDLTLRLWKHASISGRVIDEAGEPIVGVNVYALRRTPGNQQFAVTGAAVRTDDRGAFRIGLLPAGEFIVAVPSSISTRGVVPPPGTPGAPERPPLPTGRADNQRVGDWVIQGLPWGLVWPQPDEAGVVSVYPSTFYPAPPAPRMTASDVVALEFGQAKAIPPIGMRPVPTVRVSGTISNPGSDHAELVLVPEAAELLAVESGFEIARADPDFAGRFVFHGVTPGRYRLRATTQPPLQPPVRNADGSLAGPPPAPGRGSHWLSESVDVADRDVTLSLTLRPPVRVSGRFLFDGQRPAPRAEQIARDVIGLTPADARAIVNSLTGRAAGASAPGTFAIQDVAGGTYVLRRLAVPAPWQIKSIVWRGQDVIDAPLDFTEDVADIVVTFTDRPPVISGTVRTSVGAPDAEALVIVFSTNRERWSRFGRSPMRLRSVRTASDGGFSLNYVPPGEYFVAAVHDADAGNWMSPTFLEALSRVAARVRLEEGGKVAQDLRRVAVR